MEEEACWLPIFVSEAGSRQRQQGGGHVLAINFDKAWALLVADLCSDLKQTYFVIVALSERGRSGTGKG